MKFQHSLLLKTLLVTQTVTALTVQNNFADGSYCLHCSGSSALEILGCELGLLFSSCLLFNGLFDLGTCVAPPLLATGGKSCSGLGGCATTCTGSDTSGSFLDYCCFKPGSPFLTPYLEGTPSPTKSSAPAPTASGKGITCDIVDTLASQYKATSASGPNVNGYYGQVLNLACLRSTCPNPGCQRVSAVRSTDPECANYEGSFDFEQSVFGKFTTGLDVNKVAQDAASFDRIGEIAAYINGEEYAIIHNTPAIRSNPLGNILYQQTTQLGITDPRTIATVIAGTSHFVNDLGPNFNTYTRDLVSSSPDVATLKVRISNLKQEHDLLFKCAVTPGFEAQAANGELPPFPALAAEYVVPIAAQLTRDYFLYNALREIKGESVGKAIEDTLGIKLPSLPHLQWDPRNWIDTSGIFRRDLQGSLIASSVYSQPGMSTGLTEISAASGASIVISLELASSFEIDIDNSKPVGDGNMARSTLIYPSPEQPPKSPTVFKREGNDISIVGPIGSIYPASFELVFYNTSHIIPANISDPLIPVSSINTSSGSTEAGPLSPLADGTPLMYNKATISLSYNPVYVSGINRPISPETDVTIFDIVTGQPLKSVSYITGTNGGIFSAPIQPGNGVWGGRWGGGGSFALGLKTFNSSRSNNASSTGYLNSTSSSTRPSSVMVSPTGVFSNTSSVFATPTSSSSISSFSGIIAPTASSNVSTTRLSSSGSSTGTSSFAASFTSNTTSAFSSSSSIILGSSSSLILDTSRKSSTSTVSAVSGSISPTGAGAPKTSITIASSPSNARASTSSIPGPLIPKPSAQSLASYSSDRSNNGAKANPVAPGNPQQPNTVILIYTTITICPNEQTLTSGTSTLIKSTNSISIVTLTTTSVIACNSGCKTGGRVVTLGVPASTTAGSVVISKEVVSTQKTGILLSGAQSVAINGGTPNTATQIQGAAAKPTSGLPPAPTASSPGQKQSGLSNPEASIPPAQTNSKTVPGGWPTVATSVPPVVLTSSVARANGGNATSNSRNTSYSGPAVTSSASNVRAKSWIIDIAIFGAAYIGLAFM